MYVDGFVIPVPLARMDDYRAMAETAGALWMEHGALSVVETVADDVTGGEKTSFPMAVALEPGEVVVFSFITYRDRAHRDAVNAAVMADPRLQGPADSPFDSSRMMWGGFAPLVVLEGGT